LSPSLSLFLSSLLTSLLKAFSPFPQFSLLSFSLFSSHTASTASFLLLSCYFACFLFRFISTSSSFHFGLKLSPSFLSFYSVSLAVIPFLSCPLSSHPLRCSSAFPRLLCFH
jgi:hypothetical protein